MSMKRLKILVHENNKKCPAAQHQRDTTAAAFIDNCPNLLPDHIFPRPDHPHPRPDHLSPHPIAQRPADHSASA